MYIGINLENLTVLGLNMDYRVLCEIPGEEARIVAPADDPRTYKDLTIGEIRTLYLNYTGGQMAATDTQVGAVWEFINHLKAQPGFEPTTEVVATVIRAVAPKAPEAQGKAPAGRPKAGTATGQVWDIADEVYAALEAAGPIDWKTLRAAVVAKAVAAGINPATVQVQFGKWKGSK